MRELFMSELVKELLGPRQGAKEILRGSDGTTPLGEYVTGVLAPITEELVREIDNEAAIPVEDVPAVEDETSDADISAPPFFSPALDPRRIPPTMGLSFVVRSSSEPRILLCLTWARYKKGTEGQDTVWRREPRCSILPMPLDKGTTVWLGEQGEQVDPQKAEILLSVVVRPERKNETLASIYLVNPVRLGKGQIPRVEDHLFQPQIRVVCEEGTEVVPALSEPVSRTEDQRFEFLYRNRPSLARGHLCSAVWRSIDPENVPSGDIRLDFPETLHEPGFGWPDLDLLPEHLRARFSPPDVRTEFIPIYLVQSPELLWRREYGEEPQLRAERLADLWDPTLLKGELSRLTDGYEKWIGEMEQSVDSMQPHDASLAQDSLSMCRVVLGRMRSGIDLICHDEDARLAFCFANKAIDIQSRWSTHGTGLVWYPFQLAFFLMSVGSIVDSNSQHRGTCDLLWVPTGAGKTEAYLGAAAFTFAYRRRQARKGMLPNRAGAGVAVITRYTLRLLTIQQFRRALGLITACEYLRVQNLNSWKTVGWRPPGCKKGDNFLWGSSPFSIGLWVGGDVRPNRLTKTWVGNGFIPGAIEILKGEGGEMEGEPAQVLTCPACGATLAVPEIGLRSGRHRLHIVVRNSTKQDPSGVITSLQGGLFAGVKIISMTSRGHAAHGFYTLTIEVESIERLKARHVDSMWEAIDDHLRKKGVPLEVVSARASRMGYFVRNYMNEKGKPVEYDFEIFCPDPECPLQGEWVGGAPLGWIHGSEPSPYVPAGTIPVALPDDNKPMSVQTPFRKSSAFISDRIPIPALLVDQQVYHRLPTVVVATVDKFARVPFEPRAAAIFGNVDHYHCIWGYYREHLHPAQDVNGHPSPIGTRGSRNFQEVVPPEPPELILQDELHLIEGPLGSLVGIYETAIDSLCCTRKGHLAKYIASTATARRAEEQTKALFLRDLQLFPPYGIEAGDRFFIREVEQHPLDDESPGRLYVGVCAPGRGPLTPIVRIWSRLLKVAGDNLANQHIDPFWTITGYFNAVRELAGAKALYGQDIPQRIRHISQGKPRLIPDEKALELSSRTPSTDLPAILDMLSNAGPEAPDALFTTSMFGTGIDIQRLGLMVVNGQPKTTSSYIQSTGRVGRGRGGLVVTFLRAARPRDLSHYEFFCGYHRQLHRFVEPSTVYPFAPGVLERAGGPVCVFMLRSMRGTRVEWHKKESAVEMARWRTQAPEVVDLPTKFASRAQGQPPMRRPEAKVVSKKIGSDLDRWYNCAGIHTDLRYVEYDTVGFPQSPVVLGDPLHQHAGLAVVYENAPASLRDIEETTGMET